MKTLRTCLLFIHISVVLLLLGSLANAVVPPKIFPYLGLLPLAFPILLGFHLLFCLYWVFLRRKRALFFILLSIFLYNPTRRWINFSAGKEEPSNLKLLSFNVHAGFSDYSKVQKYLQSTKPDIAVLQEVNPHIKPDIYKNQVTGYRILYLGTNLEVVNQGRVGNTDTNGNVCFFDVRVNKKTVRIINVYLNPFSFEKSELMADAGNMAESKPKTQYILGKLIPTFKTHQDEVDSIHEFIKSSPYPVILAGDFNSVPNSYEYYHIGQGLQDAFLVAGSGSATSFHDYKFPIRIDYVFASKAIKPVRYKVDRTIHISDHFPVVADFFVQ